MQRDDVERRIKFLRTPSRRLNQPDRDDMASVLLVLLDRAERAEADWDAAFAAGQEEMRQKAADLCMTMDGALNNAGACAMAILTLSIKDRPE